MSTVTQTPNRYATDWNGYSASWESQFGERYQHLGDEWWDDGTSERRYELRIFANVEPYLHPDARVLEIGPGGGKWTVRLAPLAREIVVFDVAESMLERTRARCAAAGLDNVRYVLSDGSGALETADESMDLVFSYDVFVHLTLEDTVQYVGEIARVLRPGGAAIIHHAVNDVAAAWDRIEAINEWYRRGATLGQYYYYSTAMLHRLYERAGLVVQQTWTTHRTTIITVQKPREDVAARIETALRRAATAPVGPVLDEAAQRIVSVAEDVRSRLDGLLTELTKVQAGQRRYAIVQEIRRLLRA